MVLKLEDDFEVVGEAADGREALDRIHELDPDIVILDLRMPNLNGLFALQIMRQSCTRTKVIILTASEDKNELLQAMKLGCSGILLKRNPTELIVKSIRKVHAGEIWLDFHTFASKSDVAPGGNFETARKPSPLSPREKEIAQLVAQGLKNKEIAERLLICEQTVKNHLHNIFDKLGVSDRRELALFTIHEGLHLADR